MEECRRNLDRCEDGVERQMWVARQAAIAAKQILLRDAEQDAEGVR